MTKCVTKHCEGQLVQLDTYILKLHGDFRVMNKFHCPGCRKTFSVAKDVITKAQKREMEKEKQEQLDKFKKALNRSK